MQKTLRFLVIAALAASGCSYRVASGMAATGGLMVVGGGVLVLDAASATGAEPGKADRIGYVGLGSMAVGAAVGLAGIIGMVIYDPSPTNATTPSGGTVTTND